MTNKIVRVTATGLMVAMVIGGYTAQAEEINLNNDIKAVKFIDENAATVDNTTKSKELDIKIVEYKGISDVKHTNYVYDQGVKEVNTDKESILDIENSVKEEITEKEIDKLYESLELELDLFDESSNPVGTVMVTKDNRLLLEEYNRFTKCSKYYEVFNDKLVESLKNQNNLKE